MRVLLFSQRINIKTDESAKSQQCFLNGSILVIYFTNCEMLVDSRGSSSPQTIMSL